jgi:hypothetical protein
MSIRSIVATLLAYVAAAILASLFLLALVSILAVIRGGGGWSVLTDWDGQMVLVVISMMLWAPLLPFLVAITVLRWRRLNGWLAHVVAGTLVSLVALFTIGLGFSPTLGAFLDAWPIILTGGVAGFIFWATYGLLLRRVAQQVG